MAEKETVVQVSGVVGGACLAVVAILAVFAEQHLPVAAPVVGAGIVLGCVGKARTP